MFVETERRAIEAFLDKSLKGLCLDLVFSFFILIFGFLPQIPRLKSPPPLSKKKTLIPPSLSRKTFQKKENGKVAKHLQQVAYAYAAYDT